nr:RICIN domain-containing protein [Burkholderia glumae]
MAPVNPAAAGQRYDVITKPNYLLSVANHQLCIDNKGRGLSNGNPVWLYQFNGSPAQQWNLVPLMNLTLAV